MIQTLLLFLKKSSYIFDFSSKSGSGKEQGFVESILHSNYVHANNNKTLRTVATFRNLIDLSFHRLAAAHKLIVAVLLVQFCSAMFRRHSCKSASAVSTEYL